MRIKAKTVGSEVSIDDYNAFQYMLYHMNCWNDMIRMDTNDNYKGKYASYKLTRSNKLVDDEGDAYQLTKELVSTSRLVFKLSDKSRLYEHMDHMKVTCTIRYMISKNSEIYESENSKTSASPSWKDYTPITLPCEIISDNNSIKVNVWDSKTNKGVIPASKGQDKTLIYKYVTFHLYPNSIPYIDLANGMANDANEIIVENFSELENIIKYAPTDGTITSIRLDGSPDGTKAYEITSTLHIKKGQHIEIIGGSGEWIGLEAKTRKRILKQGRTILTGQNHNRLFIVEPGGKLSLSYLHLTEGKATPNGTYERGRGGAILVEALRRNPNQVSLYGLLDCYKCTFTDNTAWYGGAIFSYHAGVYLDSCDFIHNTATINGGALCYWAKDITLEFQEMTVRNGTKINLLVKVKDYLGHPVSEGDITFTLTNGETVIKKGTVNVGKLDDDKGVASWEYQIPKSNTNKKLVFTAQYKGGILYDDEVIECPVNVKFPKQCTAVFTSNNEFSRNDIDPICVKVTQNITGRVIKKDNIGKFTVTKTKKNGTPEPLEHIATFIGGEYCIDYSHPGKDYVVEVSFELDDPEYEYECKTITQQIKYKPAVGETSLYADVSNITGIFIDDTTTIQTEWYTYLDKPLDSSGHKFTDIFVQCNDWKDAKKRKNLETIIKEVVPRGNVRVHAVVDCFYDKYKKKWLHMTSEYRVNEITNIIDNILENTKVNGVSQVNGICLNYCWFSGSPKLEINDGIAEKNKNNEDARPQYITKAAKTIFKDLINKDKDIIRTIIVKVDINASSRYGQDYSELVNSSNENSKVTDMAHFLIPRMLPQFYYPIIDEQYNGRELEWIEESMKNFSEYNKKDIIYMIQTFNLDRKTRKWKKKTKNDIEKIFEEVEDSCTGVMYYKLRDDLMELTETVPAYIGSNNGG